MNAESALLSCKDVKKYYPVRKGILNRVVAQKHVVDGISLDIFEGKTVALVGESGCGKSVLLRVLLGVEKATDGTVLYRGKNIASQTPKEKQEMRSEIQMIFQDTLGSLHPRMTIGDSLEEPLKLNGMKSKEKRLERIHEVLNLVGLDYEFTNRYPHQLSGGQRQRVVIARALMVQPKLIFADEPISALDVSLQAQIINLLMNLQEKFNLSILLVAHDLAVVRQIADEIMIMYLGTIVEKAKSSDIYKDARHPYTKALLKAAPSIKKGINDVGFDLDLKVGDNPNPANPPAGCPFCTRCLYADKKCEIEKPQTVKISEGHFVSCHKAMEIGKEREEVAAV